MATRQIAVDYAAGDGSELPSTPIARWDANIDAIRTLKELETSGREATPAQQAIMAKYSGFGDSAFSQGLSSYAPREPAWQERRQGLRDLVSDEEYDSVRRSHLNACYTSPEVIDAMWKGIEDMGAGQLPVLRVLEPSAGSGRFLARQPRALAAKSERTAVEIDDLTAGLLKHLYPQTAVWHTGFQDAPVPNDSYDVAISNVPFGNYGVHDPEYLATNRKYLTRSIHNYFFAKTLDKLRPGGVMAFITTHHTMDSHKARPVREYLAERADLMGAIRLPEGAFGDTQVVTDIIYLRKRLPGEPQGDSSWVETDNIEVDGKNGNPVGFTLNRYFVKNPSNVLGEHSAEGSMYKGQSYTVRRSTDSTPLQPLLKDAVNRVASVSPNAIALTRQASPAPELPQASAPVASAPAPSTGRGKLASANQRKLQDLEEIRGKARRLLDLERTSDEDENIELVRAALKEDYQQFVGKHKALNSPGNRKLVDLDPEAPLLLALEVYDKDTKAWLPSDIFERRILGAPPTRDVSSAADAMNVAYNEGGRLDFERMGQLLGQSPEEVRDALREDRLVFHNPVGNWESADEYLTGRVREKLQIAKQVAARYPAYQANVAALEQIQPEDVPPGEIATPLGAPWIPDSVVNQWVKEHFRPHGASSAWYKYSPDVGKWSNLHRVGSVDAVLHSEWGTPKMGADEILLHVLQNSPITVTMPNPDGEGRVKDIEGTLAAQEKAARMQESFNEWVWQDPDRTTRLARIYNDTHNAVRPRVFDGSRQTFPGMAKEWQEQLREHQRDAIFRTVHDGTVLLAHEVGFGKTAVMVASSQERKRLGLIDKPMFVIPKATYDQFVMQFQEIYPAAKLLAPKSSEFSTKNREAFLSRIATGDWDAVILTGDQFKNIPVSPQTEAKWVSEQLHELRTALDDLESAEGRGSKKRTQKQIEKKIQAMETKLLDLRATLREGTDKRVTYFENLGIDQLYVDEADRYKNLPFATQMGQIKGLPNRESQRAWDMFLKVQYIQGNDERQSGSFARKGVVFATGTPIANTIAEAWTMQRYLQLPELRRRGLHHFDAWAKTYGRVTEGLEQSPAGKYRVTQRFANFVNLPELSQLFQNVADVRVASEVPEMMAARPRLVDDAGNPRRTTIVSPQYPALRNFMADLRERVDNLGHVDPEEDNMLKISDHARKAALDIRMVNPGATPNPQGKIPLAARNIAEIHRQENPDKGTQLVFLDIGTPKTQENAGEEGVEGADEGLTAAETREMNDVYASLKRELMANGVPEHEIAFVHTYKTNSDRKTQIDGDRKALFEKVNDGEIRVLVGSTEKLGVGVNVQERAAALHHLDVTWRPRDIEQREGRIVRQGNNVYGPVEDPDSGGIINPGRGVRIFNYVQEGSFDEFMWQAVEVKGQAVKALMRRNMTARVMEDADSLVLGAGEAKALASGNPLVLKAEELKNRVNTLRLQRASHRNQGSDASLRIQQLELAIAASRQRIPRMEADAALAVRSAEADFAIQIKGKPFDNRTKAGEAMKQAVEALPLTRDGDPREIGTYKGFQVSVVNTDRGYQIMVANPASDVPYRSAFIEDITAAGLVSRLDNLVKGIPRKAEDAKAKLAENELSISVYATQVGQPFSRAQELAEAERDLARTRTALSGEEAPDNFVSDTVEYAAGYAGESYPSAKNESSVAFMATGDESSPEPAPTAPVVETAPEPGPTYNLPSAMTGEPEPEPVPVPVLDDDSESGDPFGIRATAERNIQGLTQEPEPIAPSEIIGVAPPIAPFPAPAAEPEPPAASPDSLAVPTLDAANTVPAPALAPAQETLAPAANSSDTVDRELEALDALDAMSPEVRESYETLRERVSDVADEYETAMLAMRLGADPDARDVEREEATLRRRAGLAAGQQDIFGATAAEPLAMVLPTPAPVSAPPAAPVVDGDTDQKSRRVKFTPITNRLPAPVSAPPNLSPDKPDSLAAAETQVKAVAADGEVTAAEAGETASAAGKVLNAAEADTPDSPEPRRSYDSGDDIARLVEEICNDPARMQELLERAKLSKHKAEREQADDDGQTVSPEARSAAGKVMNRLRQNSPSPPGADRKSRKARISDVDLLRRAVNQCKVTDPSGPVAREAKAFLAASAPNPIRFRSKAPAPAAQAFPPSAQGRGSGGTQKSTRKAAKAPASRRLRTAKPVISYR